MVEAAARVRTRAVAVMQNPTIKILMASPETKMRPEMKMKMKMSTTARWTTLG